MRVPFFPIPSSRPKGAPSSFRPEPCAARRSGETSHPRARGFSTPRLRRSGRNDAVGKGGPSLDTPPAGAARDEGIFLILSSPGPGPGRIEGRSTASPRRVMAGLVPAIHLAAAHPAPPVERDARNKSGHDDGWGVAVRIEHPHARGFSTPRLRRSGRNDEGGKGGASLDTPPAGAARDEGSFFLILGSRSKGALPPRHFDRSRARHGAAEKPRTRTHEVSPLRASGAPVEMTMWGERRAVPRYAPCGGYSG